LSLGAQLSFRITLKTETGKQYRVICPTEKITGCPLKVPQMNDQPCGTTEGAVEKCVIHRANKA